MTEPKLRIAAGDAGYRERVRQLAESVQARFRYHSIELPDGSVLPGLQSPEHLRWRLGLFGLPDDLKGRRVLDIGAWDGWFSFECERRGAEVVAVDCVELDTFLEAKELLGSRVEYLTLDVGELSARRLGHFDIVLFFGVLYHLRHPLLGLEKAVELTTDLALIESFVIPSEQREIPSVMEFYERAELAGQVDNWCGPSPECLAAMCRSAGFAQVEIRDVTNQRASAVCRRRWPNPEDNPQASPPQLNSVVNNRTYLPIFHPLKDEYLCCYFNSSQPDLGAETVFVEVDTFGVPALIVASNGSSAWQVNCVRPPGLDPGSHLVRIRTSQSSQSNAVEFTMLDEAGIAPRKIARALPSGAPELCSVELHPSGDRRVAAGRGGSMVCYFRSVANLLGAGDILIDAGMACMAADTISSLGDGVWQVNVLLRSPVPEGTPIRLRLGEGEWSETRLATRAGGSSL